MMLPDDIAMENAEAIDRALAEIPLLDRSVALAVSIVREEYGASEAVAGLISLATIMARRLTPSQRLAIKWLMTEKLEELRAALH